MSKRRGIKKNVLITLLILVVLSLVACGNNTSSLDEQGGYDADKVIVDRAGNEILKPEKTDRIVSMAPSITQTLVHLGLADKLIAVDSYSAKLEGVPKGLPVYDMMTPDTESIVAIKPDIIFATGMSKANGDDPFKTVVDLGVMMTYIPSAVNIDGIKEDIFFIGKITNTEEKAKNIVNDMETEIDNITNTINDKKCNKNVYFEIASAPNIYSFGKDTFQNEMLEILGAKNILGDQKSWISVSEEIIIEKNPDVIFTNVEYVDKPIEDIKNRNGWNVIEAVKNNQVYFIDNNSSSLANEYCIEALEEMAKNLYPELFE